MTSTPSVWHAPHALWGRALLVNVAGVFGVVVGLNWMLDFPRTSAVPFHLIWLGVIVFYGIRRWSERLTLAILATLCLVTGGVMWRLTSWGAVDTEEVAEAPLMALVALAAVWQVQRLRNAYQLASLRAGEEHEVRSLEAARVRSASHEMRSPLTVARGYAELIEARVEDPKIQEDATAVIGALDRLTDLVRKLRDQQGTPPL